MCDLVALAVHSITKFGRTCAAYRRLYDSALSLPCGIDKRKVAACSLESQHGKFFVLAVNMVRVCDILSVDALFACDRLVTRIARLPHNAL